MAGKRKHRRKRTGLLVSACVVLLLCGIVLYQRTGVEAEKAGYEAQIQELEKEKGKLEEEGDEIQEYQAYVQTKKFVEDTARDRLGLVYDDEIVFQGEP